MKEMKVPFDGLDLGTPKPTSVPMETIHVEISTDNLFGDFAKAFLREAFRVNPLRAEQVGLTADEITQYVTFLAVKRVECVNGDCRDYRKLKSLYIPSWIQYNLSMIGRVVIRDRGLELVPVIPDAVVDAVITLEQAIAISDKVGMFEDDLQIVQDAMPRGDQGDLDVMSTAMIADYVRALSPVQHPVSTYVTAFMGMRLREEVAMKVLYRIQYDDLNFIRTALLTQKGLY